MKFYNFDSDNMSKIVDKKSGVYILKDLTKNKYYIGQSVNIYKRLRTHLLSDRLNKNGASKELRKLYLRNHKFSFGFLTYIYLSYDTKNEILYLEHIEFI